MSSSAKRPKNNQHTKQGPKQEPQQEPQTTRIQRILRWFGIFGKFLALYLSIVGSYYAFSPKIFIAPADTLDPSQLFATPFVVRNESLLSVNSIRIRCGIRNLITTENTRVVGIDTELRDARPIPHLEPLEATTIILPFPFSRGVPLKTADVDVIVSYRPALLPFDKQKRIRFRTAEAKDGTLHWYPKAISE
jgi:hypothetical protein